MHERNGGDGICACAFMRKGVYPPNLKQNSSRNIPTPLPVVFHRDKIPPRENQLRDVAFILSKKLADLQFRVSFLTMMENTPFQDHAQRWNDITLLVGNDAQLSIDQEFGQWIKVNFPVPEHFKEFRNHPESKILVAYAPMADDQQIKKIVAFDDGTALLLDAWGEAPETPTLVVSLEPILRKAQTETIRQQDGTPNDTTTHPVSCGSTRYFPNDLYLRSFKFMVSTEPWFLQPAEIYFWMRMEHNGVYRFKRLPSNGNNTWYTARKNQEKVISCPGTLMGYSDNGYVWIQMKEDDSHFPEFGSDDFIGSECAEWWYTSASWNCPGYSSVIKTYLKRNGQNTAYIRMYERY